MGGEQWAKGKQQGMGGGSSQSPKHKGLVGHCNDFDLHSERQEAPEGL